MLVDEFIGGGAYTRHRGGIVRSVTPYSPSRLTAWMGLCCAGCLALSHVGTSCQAVAHSLIHLTRMCHASLLYTMVVERLAVVVLVFFSSFVCPSCVFHGLPRE